MPINLRPISNSRAIMAGVRKPCGGGGQRANSSTNNINIPDLDLEEEVCPICFETLA